MNKRQYLTPKQKEKMRAKQGNACAVCHAPLVDKQFIAEHTHPLALGGAAKPDCLLCLPCADRKTNGSPATSYGSDKHAIAKDKRLRGVTGQGPKKRIPSRPFQKRPPNMPYQWGSNKPLSTTQEEAS
jgi:hypothetical protein